MTHGVVRDLIYSLIPDKSKYLSFAPGEYNVVISAPHGGGIKPTSIPGRRYGNRSRDSYTRRLVQKILEIMDVQPYYIYADIHRSRVDFNRDIMEACQGNEKAEELWRLWTNTLQAYTNDIRQRYTKGLYIDIHSHNKSGLFEIGYGLSVRDYLACKSEKPIKGISTMHSLALGDETEHNLLFGRRSFVGSLEQAGFKIAIPHSEKSYLNGGRNIKTFSGNGIGAIQIECPIQVLKTSLDEVAQALANSIYLFQERFLDAKTL